jgi:hypothetical protein
VRGYGDNVGANWKFENNNQSLDQSGTSNFDAFIDRDESTDVVAIAKNFLKKKSFISCLD